jgi:hypothetical protein
LIEKQLSKPEIEWENISPLKKASFNNDPVRWLKALMIEEDALQLDKNSLMKKKLYLLKEENRLVEMELALQEEKTAIVKQKVLELEIKLEESKRSHRMASTPKRLDILKLLDASAVVGGMEAQIQNTKDCWEKASFSKNCLESRLDRRNTTYCLDNEDNVKLLLGVSGAGKTRQLLELLYVNHGYYFVARKVKDVGSNDLSLCQKRSEENPDYCNYFVEVLYFVRAVVCTYLMNNGYNKPSEILLAQMYPETFFGMDIFAVLFDLYAAKVSSIQLRFIRPYFNFVVIDDIQHLVDSPTVFPVIRRSQPFLSPFILHSKNMGIFPRFILSGTGINFEYMKFTSGTDALKSLNIHYYVLSSLEPLDKSRVAQYSRLILEDNEIDSDLTEKFVQSVERFELCHGRARFIAFILDYFIESKNIEAALTTFLYELTYIDRHLFPLKGYQRDLIKRNNIYCRIELGRQWEQHISACMLDFINTGKAVLLVSGQEAADAVRNGLGFCGVLRGYILSVQIVEVAVIYCLRSFIPFTSLAQKIIAQMETNPTPHMAGFMLEYLVGYALVSNINPHLKDDVKAFLSTKEVDYLTKGSENEIYFPVQSCGPFILYKSGRCVHIVQVKLTDSLFIEERMHTSWTSNPKPNNVYRQRLELIEALKNFEVKRYVINHTNTKPTEGMETIIINKHTHPDFFNHVFPGAWKVLDNLREHVN